MHKLFALTMTVFGISVCMAQPGWQVQPVPIQTRWAKDVSPSNALPEYPRPQMVRGGWVSLNGLWDYAITVAGDRRTVAKSSGDRDVGGL
jgi:hypothetical protein